MVSNDDIICQTERFVRKELEHDSSGHDWWHIHRVRQLALQIAKQEGANLMICELAALLHDIADEKLNPSKEAGMMKVETWLDAMNLDAALTESILEIISTMSYNGGHQPEMKTIEGQVVQDADRLDALGAIGIARTFAYAGWKGHMMHHPEVLPRESMSAEEYRNQPSTAINHFYEKLLKLKDLMNTPYAREIAEQRHEFMKQYLRQFYMEWESNE